MVIAFVPVRGGSKSIPLKNIKPFCGKPLVYWTLDALQRAGKVDLIILATDSCEIKKTVEEFNFSKVKIFDRSAENASDSATTESVMLEYLQFADHGSSDTFLLVQATSPLTKTRDFENALKQFFDSGSDSMLSVVKTNKFFWNARGESINYNFLKRPRRQDYEGSYIENGAFYISRVSSVIAHKNRLCGKVGLFEMGEHTAFELDEPADWEIGEQLMKKYNFDYKRTGIKLFVTDVDGVLTDAGMYYSENGDELKKFNTRDGKGFELLRNAGIKTALITTENTRLVERRAQKLRIDYLYQGKEHGGKLEAIKEICMKENISLNEVAYIGDDINCKHALENVGFAACPADAENEIKSLSAIYILQKNGGEGCVREFVSKILKRGE